MRLTARMLISSTLAVSAALAAPTAVEAVSPEWVDRWTEDLRFALTALDERHPDAYTVTDRTVIAAATESLIDRLPELEHHQVVVELARIVALVGDGHTRATLPLAAGVELDQGHSPTQPPALPAMQMHQLPVRVAVDSAGVWVVATTAAHRDLLGGRVVAVGGRPIADVIAALRPTIRHDNEMQVLEHLPLHLVLAEVLHACGLIPTPAAARWRLALADGADREVELRPLPPGPPPGWVQLGEDAGRLALAARHPERNLWFEPLPDARAIYLQFNTVYDMPDETIRQLGERLVAAAETTEAETLIIDLRRNRGGDQDLARPLLAAIQRTGLARAGHLFTLIGRTTFSAAMTFSLELERYTPTIFVGEPTGSRPNHFGDSRKVQLPRSGVTLRISSLWWQWDPRDERPWIAPHVLVEPAVADLVAGRDRALEIILELAGAPAAGPLAGTWRGVLTPTAADEAAELVLEASGEGLRGGVTIPAFQLAGVEVPVIAGPAATLTLDLPLDGQGVLHYTVRRAGDWVVGRAELGSYLFPVVLRRHQP